MSGYYAIVRTISAGVFAGVVQSLEDTGDSAKVSLTDCRRLWYWKPKAGAGKWLTAVALSGLHSDSRVGPPISPHGIWGVIEVIPTTAEAEASIRSHPDD